LTEEQFAWFGLTIGASAFTRFILFIVLRLAWASKAGNFSTFVFLSHPLCMLCFVVKGAIQWVIDNKEAACNKAVDKNRATHDLSTG
jgi:hypothetical protein